MSAAIGLQAAEVETREPDIIQNSDQQINYILTIVLSNWCFEIKGGYFLSSYT